MMMTNALDRLAGFLRGDYPSSARATGHLPMLALLQRRLSDDEIRWVTSEFTSDSMRPISMTDIRVAISKATNELPIPADVERVVVHLQGCGRMVLDDHLG